MFKTLLEKQTPSTLKIAGDILYVAEGKVDATIQPINLNEFGFALGSGTFSDIEKYGEAIIINSHAYISWVEDQKECTDTKKVMNSAFVLGIDPNQKPSRLFYYKPKFPTSMKIFYEQLAKEYSSGYAILGNVKFSELQSTYLNQLPIQGVAASWKELPSIAQSLACIFGVIMPQDYRANLPQELVQRSFGPVFSHTHGAILTRGSIVPDIGLDTFYDSLNNLPVTFVRHIFDQSIIDEGIFTIYPIEQLIGIF